MILHLVKMDKKIIVIILESPRVFSYYDDVKLIYQVYKLYCFSEMEFEPVIAKPLSIRLSSYTLTRDHTLIFIKYDPLLYFNP